MFLVSSVAVRHSKIVRRQNFSRCWLELFVREQSDVRGGAARDKLSQGTKAGAA